MMVFYLVVMIRYSLLLTVVGLFTVLLNIWVSRVISHKRTNITRVMMRDQGNLSGTTVSGIEMIETIKASGAENGFFEKWSGYQANVNRENVKFQKLNAYLGMIPGLLTSFANIIVLTLGVALCIRGSFTTGMILAFQGFMSSFMSPASSLISSGNQIQEMRSRMERIEDVMSYPSDPAFGDRTFPENPLTDTEDKEADYESLTGQLTMKNVSFGYSKFGAPLLRTLISILNPGTP